MSGKVYFEKQGSDRLCGVHCLNSLLQGPVFTQVDLNKIASELDKQESTLLSGDKANAPAPRSMTISSLSNRPDSHNVDASGNFSLGVLERALGSKYNLHVENVARRDIIQDISRNGFVNHEGFVIHLRDHWFSARLVSNQWYFLDSLKSCPQPVSENDLWGTIQGLIQSGSNVFVISGGKFPIVSIPPRTPLKAHQYLMTKQEIDKLLQEDSRKGLQDEDHARGITAKPVTTDWTQLGQGQSLNGTKSSSAPTHMDADVKAALLASLGELAPEPADGDAKNVVHLCLRWPSGQRTSRKFSLSSNTLEDVFLWVSHVAVAEMGLEGLVAVKLVGRGVKIEYMRGGEVLVGGKQWELSARLGEAGLQSGQELLNLSI